MLFASKGLREPKGGARSTATRKRNVTQANDANSQQLSREATAESGPLLKCRPARTNAFSGDSTMRQLTKILATLGPSSDSPEQLQKLVENGVRAVRINFSHGENDHRAKQIETVREVERLTGYAIAILADLSGPKIRVGEIAGDGLMLEPGGKLVIQREPIVGANGRVSCSLPHLLDDIAVGDPVLIADGRRRLEVIEKSDEEVVCRVIRGGIVTSRKGINLPSTDLSLSALTPKDRTDAAWIAKHDIDYVALSFVQRAQDVEELRTLLWGHDCTAPIVSKIEKPLAVKRIDSIIAASDAVMVARGDLAVEMDYPLVPVAQKRIAHKATMAGKPCIIATEMMESMVKSPVPTRAEVSDVANAVLDGADAVMLSAETAVGDFPVETVSMMSRTVREILNHPDVEPPVPPVGRDLAVSAAVKAMINAEDVAVAIIYSQTGRSARLLSKTRPPCAILGLSQEMRTVRQMVMYRGVIPVRCIEPANIDDLIRVGSEIALARGLAKSGDRLMFVTGRSSSVPGSVDGLILHRLP